MTNNYASIFAVLSSMPLDGGCTLKAFAFKTYKSGWQVATDGIEVATPVEALETIIAYGGTCGVWRDPATGLFCIDRSKRVQTKREAMRIGKECSQKTILRWRDMSCIEVA